MRTPVVTCKTFITKTGIPTVSVRIDDQPEFFLHSTIDPVQEGRDWLARVELTEHTAYVILGFGLGYHIKELLEKLPLGSHIYVIDPVGFNLLKTVRSSLPDSSWMDDSRLGVSAEDEIRGLGAALAEDMSRRYINKVTICRYYPSMHLAPEFYRLIETELVAKVGELFCGNFNNRISLGIKRIENSWLNVPYISSSPGIKALAARFAGIPVIIVAAGPSLDKNIEILKKCTDRAVVIAAGSTMGALHDQGITPCFLAAVDTEVAMYENLKGFFDPETILLSSYDVHHKLVSEYPGKKMFILDQNTLKGIRYMLPETDLIAQNISVATMAFNFALYCGADPIIFVGQDLSFAADSQHAKGVKAGDYSKNELQTIFVPGYEGGEVPTVFELRDVIEYYESIIKLNQGVSFINATEGGARIPGTRQLKLSEVYEQFLQKTISVDSIIGEAYSGFINPSFTELLNEMLDIRVSITRMHEEIDKFMTGILREVESDHLQTMFEDFFEKLPQCTIYKDIEPILAPLRELVIYNLREGISFERKIEVYLELINNLRVALEKLNSVVETTVERMKIKCGHTRNGRKEA